MVQNNRRDEAEIVFQEPIKVILGGREYKIKPLVIKYSRPWRKKLAELVASANYAQKVNTDKPEEFKEAVQFLMAESIDTVIDLFFEYAKDLKREEIEEIATEAELGNAFEAIMSFLSESPIQPMRKPSRSRRG